MQPTIPKSTLKAAVTERRFVIIKWIKCCLGNGMPVRFMVLPRQGHAPVEPRIWLRVWEANLPWMDHYILGKEMGF